jgi:hypothetical protein
VAGSSQLLGLLSQVMGGDTSRRLGAVIEADESKTATALSAALPLLLAALAKNAQTPEGAASLHGALARDHDGSVLENVSGLVGGEAGGEARAAALGDGEKILAHVLGGRRPQAQNAIGRASGLDPAQVGMLLAAAAPLVLGALGKLQRRDGLDANGVSALLGSERANLENSAPGFMGLAGKVLDRDGDGDVDAADLAGAAGMLGKLLGGR